MQQCSRAFWLERILSSLWLRAVFRPGVWWLGLLLISPSVRLAAQETFSPDRLPSYVHPPVLSPIPDGIKLSVPDMLGNRRLAKLGYVDVSAAPFHADPTGRIDSTKALQRAIDFARDAQMVCFFPFGTYRVSDTLVLRHGIHMRSHRATLMNNRLMPCVLVGELRQDGTREPVRPRIVLADHAPGFDDRQQVKYVLEHRQYEVKKFTITKKANGGGPSLMNAMVVNLDIDLGRGNAGAAGMLIRSAEGSAVQNVTIDASGGYAGIVGATGNGGSWANVTVNGGRVGLDMRGWTPPNPVIIGITLRHQTEAAIRFGCRGSLTAVGIRIESRIPGPLIIGEPMWGTFDGGLSLVDSRVSFDRKSSSQPTVLLESAGNVYLNNVYLHGADDIMAPSVSGAGTGWVRIKELAVGKERKKKNLLLSSPIYIDGKKIHGVWLSKEDGARPPADLQSRHRWKPQLAWWQSDDVANVKDARYGARGDSLADDTDALQRAIDERTTVFLPKGYYRITRTLKLRPDTRLVGVASHLSVIMARDPSKWIDANGRAAPLVETSDAPDGRTVIAYVGMRIPVESRRSAALAAAPLYALHWRCGRRSIYLSNDVHPLRLFGFRRNRAYETPELTGPTVLVDGHGGGRWYNYHTTQFFHRTTATQRAILVRRTSEPLRFYSFEPQGGRGRSVAELRRARYVSFFGCKTECDTTFLRIADCDHVRVFGHGGIGNAGSGEALYVVERTPNFLIANLADQVNLKPDRPYYSGHSVHRNIRSFHSLLHVREAGEPFRVPSLERPVLYRWGTPVSTEVTDEPQGGAHRGGH